MSHHDSIDNVPVRGHNIFEKERDLLPVIFYEAARNTITNWPIDIKKDLGSLLTILQKRLEIGPPDTKPLKVVDKRCFEIRLKGSDGIYRVLYILKQEMGILVFHGFKKKTQKTPDHEIKTGKIRLAALLKELNNEK